jgi:hypothetical protein
MSTLPPSAANAARNAINAVNADFARKDAQLDDGDGQELMLEDRPEEMRTVFTDPTTYNVKVRILSFTAISAALQWFSFAALTCSGDGDPWPLTPPLAPTLLSLDALVRFPCN